MRRAVLSGPNRDDICSPGAVGGPDLGQNAHGGISVAPSRSALVLALVLGTVSAEARVVRLSDRAPRAGARRPALRPGRPLRNARRHGRVRARSEPLPATRRSSTSPAPRNAHGEVVFSADFYVIKPVDYARGNGRVYYEVPNRGGKGILRRLQYARSSLDPREQADFGDGWLMRQGFTLVWMGWQWDVPEQPGLLRLRAPIASDGPRPITGLVRAAVVARRAQGRPPRSATAATSPTLPSTPTAPTAGSTSATTDSTRPSSSHASAGASATRRRVALDGGFEPGRHLRGRLQEPRSARGGLRLHRDTRPDQLLQERQDKGEPARRHHARLRPRHLAERPLPAPPALPGLQPGRGGPPRLRRCDRRGGRRRPRVVQPPLRAGLARRLPALEHPLPDGPVPVHRPSRARPRDAARRAGLLDRATAERHRAQALPPAVGVRVLEPRGVRSIHTDPAGTQDAALADTSRDLLHRVRAARAGVAAACRRRHERQRRSPRRRTRTTTAPRCARSCARSTSG